MTLCVAAECKDHGKQKVVFAADFNVESEIGKAEIEAKTAYVCKEEFPVMIAGSGSRGRELITQLGDVWDNPDFAGKHFMQACKDAIRAHKYSLADEYISARFGFSYQTLLEKMRDVIPEEQYREVMADIGKIRLGCDLLVIYFDHTESLIFRINDTGLPELCTNFAAIGSGIYIAEATLFQREHSGEDSLATTIYHVYEAMKAGSIAPGVGKQFVMAIAQLGKDGNVCWEHIQPKYLKFLEAEYKKFGPKNVTGQKVRRDLIKLVPRDRWSKDDEDEDDDEESPTQSDSQKSGDQQ